MAVTSAVRRLAVRLASSAPVPVFAAVGAGARDRVEALALRSELRRVGSPRHAAVLLVAGSVPRRSGPALDRVHDQLAHPRATLRWGAEVPAAALRRGDDGRGAEEASVAADADPVPALVTLHRALLRGERASEEPRLPDEPPAPWRGRGEHGQGGEGMMGGVPYGRPMARTADDLRDGLALDRLTFTAGPFFPPLPPGLVLRVALQGDVIQSAEVVEPPFPQSEPDADRARRYLHRAARLLRVAGAGAAAERAIRLAIAPDLSVGGVRRLRDLLRRGGTLRALPPAEETAGVDVRARLRGWLDAAERGRGAGEEGPGDDELARLPDLLPGLEWGDAMLLVAALDPVPDGAEDPP